MSSKVVCVLVGSRSDLVAIKPLLRALHEMRIEMRVSVLSAHRHHRELAQYVDEGFSRFEVFVTAAGKAAALPGQVAALTDFAKPIIGVPLSSPPYGPMDAVMSMISMPPGAPVQVVGDPQNAAIAVAQILALSDLQVVGDLRMYLARLKRDKPPEIEIDFTKYLTDEPKEEKK